jgi:hypothetical protein
MIAHSRRTAARRTIAWCLGGLLFGQLALAVTLERWRPDLRDPEYGFKLLALRKRLAENPGRPLVLALGSSRTAQAVRPDRLAPSGGDPAAPLVFNFGLTAHGPVREMLALHRLLRDGIRPAAVLLEQTPLMLPMAGTGLDEPPLERQTWGDLRQLRTVGPPKDMTARWLADRAASSYSCRFPILSRYAPWFVPWSRRESHVWDNTDGWGWLNVPPVATPEAVRRVTEQVVRDHRGVMAEYRISPTAERADRMSLQCCAAEGIAVAVVLLPESSEVRACYDLAAEVTLLRYHDRLRAEFGVPVIDARDWCPDDGFRDGHHLIPTGAGVFTERFGRDVLPALSGGRDHLNSWSLVGNAPSRTSRQ